VFSIIVPTFNRSAVSSLAVKSLLAQEANFAYEVIVVDNNSTDDTRERIQRLCEHAPEKLRYLFEKKQGVSVARNAGITAARGDIIAFIDDDAIAQPGWLNALAETYHMHPDAWCVGGKIILELPEELPLWFGCGSEILMSHLGRLDLGDATVERRYPNDVFGGNFSVRRDVLGRVGLFDITLGPVDRYRIESEETELCWRIQQAGGAVYYCGRAIVTHLVPAARMTKRYFRSRARWSGRTWALLDRKDVLHVRPGDLLRAALRIARNWIRSWISPGWVDRCKVFEEELAFWRCLGYLQQAALTRFGPL
jgi:glucosyl-dolichyl phosphate glucuronosyltransferase